MQNTSIILYYTALLRGESSLLYIVKEDSYWTGLANFNHPDQQKDALQIGLLLTCK